MSLPVDSVEERAERCCSAEDIFGLCEGCLEPDRARAVRSHLRVCAECRRLYEREKSLSAALSGPAPGESGGSRAGSPRSGVACRVAMALPTRSGPARVVWGAGGAALLAAALISLSLHAVQPVSFVSDFMATCWGLTSGMSDAAGILLAVSGPTILVALVVGAFVDTLIAAMLLAVARWWRPRGA